MMALLFLLALLVDVSQPALAPEATYILMAAYIVMAAGLSAVTWNSWWLDARLAGPSHALDIGVFTALVLLTEGYTSPFFTFFMFLLLSAAIRWGWRETALTAILLTLLYLTTGMLVVRSDEPFELQRFVVRTGHLIILSLILIWFGVSQWGRRFQAWDAGERIEPSLARSRFETALLTAMAAGRAKSGAFLWHENGVSSGIVVRDGKAQAVDISLPATGSDEPSSPFLYDLPRNRALRRDAERSLHTLEPTVAIPAAAVSALGLREGLAVPIAGDSGHGVLFLEDVANLSIDHIDLGEQIASRTAAHLQRHELLRAADESAEARSRLALARDLHDSVVQFLAGAAFRLEAMKRSVASGRDVEPDLNELKGLMLEEQGELRSFINALRSGSKLDFNDLARDLKGLSERLARHWGIDCTFSARPARMKIASRMHLDAQHLTREAVANAVRHAGAKTITIELHGTASDLRLDVTNDGARYPKKSDSVAMPQSMLERVSQAGGEMDVSRGMGVTKVSIALPVNGVGQ